MEHTIFTQLSIVLAISVAISFVMRFFRQPLIIGYIITGMIVGPGLHMLNASEAFGTFADLGVALLLFITGLELNTRVVKEVGKASSLTSLVQLTSMGLIGFAAALLLHFSVSEAFFIALALNFSSTIIVIKLLNDLHEQTRLYAKIAVGLLLIEDLIAAVALIFIAAGGQDTSHSWLLRLGLLSIKGLGLAALLATASVMIFPRISRFLARSQEFLFLFALAWGFGVASIFDKAGFSIEVGALFAGVALASMPYAREIGARLKPLRDFFLVVFFIALGAGLQFANLPSAILPALVFSLIVIFVKPFLIMSAMGLLGYTKRTAFKAAIFMNQISEFSLILLVLASSVGLVPESLVTIFTLVALVTITTSTYMIKYADRIFNYLEAHLHFFERKIVEPKHDTSNTYHVALFGYRKGGHDFLRALQKAKESFVVVDYDPDVIEILERQKVEYLYGDVTDLELLSELNLPKTRCVISTITDQPTNLFLTTQLQHLHPGIIFICRCDTVEEAIELYENGATYVMMPHYLGSEKFSSFIRTHGLHKNELKVYREKHLARLQHRDD